MNRKSVNHSTKVATKLGLGLILMSSLALTGCGDANPRIALSFGSYTAHNRLLELLMPSAYAALGDGHLCFKRLRFKQDGESTSADPTADNDNIDFSPGYVAISTVGSVDLGEVTVPAGTYTRLEFDLENNCPGAPAGSPSVSYDQGGAGGAISTMDRVTIKFEGSFEASHSGQQLVLGIQSIINALNSTAADGSNIKNDLEAAGVAGTL